MSLSIEQIEKQIKEIERLASPSSKRYGRLLNWQNPFDPFWHYGIGLSDIHIFDTGRGLCPFERKEAQFVDGIESISFEPEQVIERLKQALYVFAGWEYTITGWNCEHLGRLIVTDRPRCYQSSLIWWLCDLTPEGDHKTAHQVFREYLQRIAPSSPVGWVGGTKPNAKLRLLGFVPQPNLRLSWTNSRLSLQYGCRGIFFDENHLRSTPTGSTKMHSQRRVP